MTLETMSQLGEFVGGFGVIFSLVYVALQVRSNTRSQRADMAARVLERLAAMQHTFAFDLEANKFFTQGLTQPTSLSAEERSRFLWGLTEFFGAMEFLIQQHKLGNIDEQIWLRWSATLDWWLTFPGVRAAWVGRATPYTDLFTNHVEDRFTNGDFSFNIDNNRNFIRSGKLPDNFAVDQ